MTRVIALAATFQCLQHKESCWRTIYSIQHAWTWTTCEINQFICKVITNCVQTCDVSPICLGLTCQGMWSSNLVGCKLSYQMSCLLIETCVLLLKLEWPKISRILYGRKSGIIFSFEECFSIIYTRKNLTFCNKFVNKPSTSCLRTACHKLSTSLEQAVNNL